MVSAKFKLVCIGSPLYIKYREVLHKKAFLTIYGLHDINHKPKIYKFARKSDLLTP
jgi:hypothetical protein